MTASSAYEIIIAHFLFITAIGVSTMLIVVCPLISKSSKGSAAVSMGAGLFMWVLLLLTLFNHPSYLSDLMQWF
ncbi:hypothetical protein [Salibacterium sp. K-3]